MRTTLILAAVIGGVLLGIPAASAVELTAKDIVNPKGDGPDGKGNTADDTWGFWFELIHNAEYRRLDVATKTMSAQERAKGRPRKITGPIGAWVEKGSEGWIYHSDWDGRGEGVWGNEKSGKMYMHPYNEKTDGGDVAVTYKVPKDGTYTITAKATDLNVAKGHYTLTGITAVIDIVTLKGPNATGKPLKTLAKAKIGDDVGPKSKELTVKDVELKAGQLVRLAIDPNKWWGADMTEIEFKIEPAKATAAPTPVADKSSDKVVELTIEHVLNADGDGPDGKGNTADDTWQFWFELVHKKNTFRHLDVATKKMSAQERAKGRPRKITGPIAARLPNPKDTEGWIYHSDWDGRFEGVWADKKTKKVMLHPYVEKGAHEAVALSYKVSKAGTYTITSKLVDEKKWVHKRHDGIYWKVMVSKDGNGGKVLAKGGPFGDGRGPKSVDVKIEKAELKAGDLVFLIIDPGRWWGADLTVVDFLRIERVSD